MGLQVVVGGQYGSESKGRVTAWLTQQAERRGQETIVVRVAGPNAGHVAYDTEGKRWALRQIPIGMVVSKRCLGVIAAGSEIDPRVLQAEIETLEASGHRIRERLIIDPEATIIDQVDKDAESALVERIGSTGKGIGAARAARLMRLSRRVTDHLGGKNGWGKINIMPTAPYLNDRLVAGQEIIIEGTQGYGLGLHAGHYPQCTSSDCRAIDFLAMAGVSPWLIDREHLRIWVVIRPYPIRVAGNSGPLNGETSWDELGLPTERTTVTNKVRRVGMWDPELAATAVDANGGGWLSNRFASQQPNPTDVPYLNPVRVALAMADHAIPSIKDKTYEQMLPEELSRLWELIYSIERDTGAIVESVGTGPQTTFRVHLHRLGGMAQPDRELLEIVDDREQETAK